MRPWIAGACLLVVIACVGPARTFDVYEGKAVATAEAARSAVESARIAATVASRDRATGQFASVALSEAEADASSAQGAFDSIQPPDARADRLRDEPGDIVADALDLLAQLRIAVRRGELTRLTEIARPLDGISRSLDAFIEAHQ